MILQESSTPGSRARDLWGQDAGGSTEAWCGGNSLLHLKSETFEDILYCVGCIEAWCGENSL